MLHNVGANILKKYVLGKIFINYLRKLSVFIDYLADFDKSIYNILDSDTM